MSASLLSLVFGACASLLLLVYSTYAWLAPTTPLVIGAFAIFLPTLLLLVALEPKARPPKPDITLWLSSLVIGLLFGLILPASWNRGAVRAKALSAMPSARTVELAAADDDPEVQAAACSMLFDERLGLLPADAAKLMSTRPATFAACLKSLPASSKRDAVVAYLLKTWRDELISGAADACSRSEAIAALPVPAPNQTGVLLDCALGPNADARTCCVEQLATQPEAELQRNARAALPVLRQLGGTAELLATAFDEKQVVARVTPAEKRLKLQTTPMRRVALRGACEAIVSEGGRPDDMRYLEWLFDQHTQCLEDEDGTTDPVEACSLVLEGVDTSDLGELICSANQAVRKRKAKAAAAFKAGVAFGEEASAIDQGRATLQADKLSNQGIEKLIRSGELRNLSSEEMKLVNQRVNNHVPAGYRDTSRDQVKGQAERGQLDSTESAKGMKATDAEKVLGVSMEELKASIGEDGEVSDEMRERLQNARGGD